jgi:hypothetical protein
MLTTIYALIVAAIIGLPALLLYLFDKKQKRSEAQKLLQHLAHGGLQHNLSFTSQEVAGRLVFALDGINRKMLVVERDADGAFVTTLIDLNKVRACAMHKHFARATTTGFGTDAKLSNPTGISLMIYTGEKHPFEVRFYSSEENSPREAMALEKKARHWEQLLSKMASTAEKRA